MTHRSLCSLAVVFGLTVSAGTRLLHAQTPPEFEVASIKFNKAGVSSPQRAGLAAGERVTMINVPLLTLLQIAYPGMTAIVGAPNWVGSMGSPNFDADRFDVNAKADVPSSVDQLRRMLQALLADRFKLAVHTEPRPTDVYVLRLARADGRLGPGLRAAAVDCRALVTAALEKDPALNVSPCGTVGTNLPPWHIRGVPITYLSIFRVELGKPVVDKTGLTGSFDIDLDWTPSWFASPSFEHSRFPNIDPVGPELVTAVREQLGLRLVSEKDDQPVLVIDHVEPPTPD